MVRGGVGGWPWLIVETNTLVEVVLGSTHWHGHFCRLAIFPTKEVKLGNIPGKEFRVMILKMIQDLRKKKKKIEVPINQIPEMFNEDLGKVKNNTIQR